MTPADWTWVSIPAIVITHNTVALIRGREQMSQACDRYRLTYPILTDTVIAATALHLSRRLPEWADPIHWLFSAVSWLVHTPRWRRP